MSALRVNKLPGLWTSKLGRHVNIVKFNLIRTNVQSYAIITLATFLDPNARPPLATPYKSKELLTDSRAASLATHSFTSGYSLSWYPPSSLPKITVATRCHG